MDKSPEVRMITTICLNPAFDKTVTVDELHLGEVNRILHVREDLGGKGINVAAVALRLGLEAKCLGCMGETGSERLREMMTEHGIPFEFMTIPGSIRTNLKVVSHKGQAVTELNEPGCFITREQLDAFMRMVLEKGAGSFAVLTGSLPPGCPEETYREIILKLKDVPCILDAEGNSLLLGLNAHPLLVKPNLSELESTLKTTLRTLRSIRDAAYVLLKKGAQSVIVSMGKMGALFTDGQQTLYSPALGIKVLSTVGAGDAMVGGVLLGLTKGESLAEAFRSGMAAGAASVMTEGTQPISAKDYQALLPKVAVQEV
jgi:1-phosphofructokinase